MANSKDHFRRPDGITEIVPVYPENIRRPHSTKHEMVLGHDLPFSEVNDKSKFCIRDSIAITDPHEQDIIEGIIVFEIRPESWTLIYVPTEKLRGFYYPEDVDRTELDEFDYLNVPLERIYTGFKDHILAIMQACVDYMNENPDLSADAVGSIEETIQDLNRSTTKDFTVDIYIPPRICDLTGEIYLRPGGGDLFKFV
jgi:hypothetical protein